MSMNFCLTGDEDKELTLFPNIEVSLFEEYSNLEDELCDEFEEQYHYMLGYYWDHSRGYCKVESSKPTVNMSNSNARYILIDILDVEDPGYCGDLEDLHLIRTKLKLNSVPGCYYGIVDLLELVEIAIANDFDMFYA